MIKNTHTNILLNTLKAFAIPAFGALALIWSSPTVQAGVDGAFLQGAKLEDDSTNLKITAHKAVKWSIASVDSAVFEHPAGNPTRLKFKQAGDYFIALTAPLIQGTVTNGGRRSDQEFVVFKNGAAVAEGATRCTYIRHASGHAESSGHVHFLLTGVAVDDYVEVKTKRNTTTNSNDTTLQTTSLYVEKIAASRVAFSGTATRTVAGTNLNGNASGLQWTSGRKDAGFTHSANGHEITLDAAGKYLVFVNIPFYGAATRGSIALEVKLNGSRITGGLAQQGYIRNAEGDKHGSVHWAGLVTATAGQKLSINALKKAGGGTITVQASEKASIFIEKLADATDLFAATATQVVTNSNNWNPASKSAIQWSTEETIDTNVYTHAANSHQITIKTFGDYLLIYNDALKDGSARDNPRVTVQVNGNDVIGAESKTHYNRRASGHDESSASLVILLPGLGDGDVVTVSVQREAGGGSDNDEVPAKLTLLRRPTPPPPTIPTLSWGNDLSGDALHLKTSRLQTTLNVIFKQAGALENVTGFDASDITVSGGTISNFTQVSGSTYSFLLKANPWPGQATFSIAAAAAKDSSNDDCIELAATGIDFIEGAVTRSSNLLAHWKFDEGSGTDTFDSSSKGNHMGIGGATWTTGKFGNAFSYDAKSTALPLGAHPPASGTAYSLSFWANGNTSKLPGKNTSIMESKAGGRIINLHWPWSNKNLYFDSGNGGYDRINVKLDNGTTLPGGDTASAEDDFDNNPGRLWGQWTHYVVTHNRGAGTMRIYLNDVEIKNGTGKTKQLGNPTKWFLGANGNGNGSWWYGKVDDFRVYDVELNPGEIGGIYAGDMWPQLTPLITADDAGKRIQTVTVSFKVETTATSVTGFTAADLNVTGGAVTGFTGSGSTYTFTLTPTTYPSDVTVNIPLHSLESADGNYANIATTSTIPFKLPGFRNDSHGGLALWLDGNEITDVVVDPDAPQTITTWPDASGAGNHMSNVVGDPKLVEGPNGNQVVQYTNDRTYTSKNFEGDLLPLGYTAFGVSRYTGGDNERVIASSNNWLFGHHGNKISRHHFNKWVDDGNGLSVDNAFHVFVASNEPSKANNENVTPKVWIWMDGVLRKDGVNSHDNNPAPQQISFGAQTNGGESSNSEVAEFIMYKGIMLEENRKKVEGYLAQKWGINLPSSHPYMGDDPYANAVAPKVTTTKLAGNVGLKVNHYKITGSFSPDWFGIYQAPSWMSVNSATGRLSGIPTAAGSFNLTLIVSTANGLTGAWKTKIKVTAAPSVTADDASEIGLYGADMTGTVTGTGGDTTVDVWAYYGLTDGGDDPFAWEKAIKIGAYENTNTFRGRALGLFIGKNYKYRLAARNQGGNGAFAWTATKSFNTLSSLSPPQLGESNSTTVGAVQTLKGNIATTGGEYPIVKILWGNEDAGQNPAVDKFDNAKWDNEIDFGTLAKGDFTADVSNLLVGNIYYFRVYAVNAGGAAWSPLAVPFTPTIVTTRKSDLLALWPFDEGTGSTVADKSGNNNNIGDIGSVTWTAGKMGNALEFDAASVQLPIAAHPPSSDNQFSIAFWAYGRADKLPTNTSIIESKRGNNRVLNMHHPWGNGRIYWDVGDGGTDRIEKNSVPADYEGRWTHWVMTNNKNPRSMRIYMDGVEWFSRTDRGRNWGAADTWYLGANRNGNGSWWYGKVDDLRVYNVELTPADVAEIHNGGAGQASGDVPQITSSLAVSANLNQPFSYTITSNDPNALLDAYGMPPGLSVNTTTGVISGSPTVGGVYKIYLIANGSDASNIAIMTLTLPTSAPVVALNNASGVYATSASATGTVQYNGGSDPTIILVWGETDEGTSDHEDWDDFATLGAKGVGPFNRTITGLSKSTPFYFRVKATNSGGTVWTPTKTFTTLENAVKPVLGNINIVSNITSDAAVFNTSMEATGGATTTGKFYWGTTDGGTTPGSWQNSIDLGQVLPGVPSGVLNPGDIGGPNVYFVRTAFTNSAGITWTPESIIFTAKAEPLSAPGLIAGGLSGNMSFDENPGNLDTDTSNSGAVNGIDPLGPSVSESKVKPPWKDNWTVVYTGQIYDDDGKISFQEDIDDKAWLKVNGEILLNDSGWNRETTATKDFGQGGWFDFELRMSNGGGGAGRAQKPTGFGYDPEGGSSWSLPRNADEETADVFRYGIIDVTPHVTSANIVAAGLNKPFRYQIQASNGPISFDAYGEPAWLSVNQGTGVLTGTPTAVGSFTFKVSAFTAYAAAVKEITLNVVDLDQWLYSMPVTLAYTGDDNLYGFPANYKLSEASAPGFKYSQVASPNGRDLRFTDAAGGTLLPYQVDEWNPAGTSRIWVKVPKVGTLKTYTGVSITRHEDLGAYWALNEGSGTKAGDLSGKDNNASWTGGGSPNWVDAKFGKGIHFNSAGRMETDVSFKGTNSKISALTVSAWAKLDSLGTNGAGDSCIFSNNVNNANTVLLWWDWNANGNGSQSYVFKGGNGNPDRVKGPTRPVTAGSWNHVAAVWSGKNRSIYVNGIKIVSGNANKADLNLHNNKMSIGYWTGNGNDFRFEGVIDDVRLYKAALTSDDITAIYGNGSGDFGPANDPIVATQGATINMLWGNPAEAGAFPAYVNNGSTWSDFAGRWNMDDDEGTQIWDASPNGNHATKSNVDYSASGILGGSQDFQTGNGSGALIPASGNLNLGSVFTASMWLKFEGNAVSSGVTNDINYHRILSAKSTWNEKLGFEFMVRDNNQKRVHGRGAQDNPNFQSDIVDDWKLGEWEFITAVFDGPGGKIHGYNDGVLKFSSNMSAPGNTSKGLAIGNQVDMNDNSWDGKIDELRIAPVHRSGEWIKFAYENQKFDAALFGFGDVAGPPFFGDVAAVYGKKGKAMNFIVPTFGTVDSLSAVGLPAGLSLNVATGEISGTPVGGGSSEVTFSVTGKGVTVTKKLPVKIVDLDLFVYKMEATLSGYAGSEELADFPVLLRLDNSKLDGFSFYSFLAQNGDGDTTGFDLRVYDDDGRELEYEIENWNNPVGTAEVWVKAPKVTSSTKLTVAWANPAETDMETYTYDGTTWTNDFAAVWHMNKTVAGKQLDSAFFYNHADAAGFVDGNVSTPMVGPFRDQGPGSAGAMTAPPGNLNSVQTDNYTLSGWVKRKGSAGMLKNAFLARGWDNWIGGDTYFNDVNQLLSKRTDYDGQKIWTSEEDVCVCVLYHDS